ncbi:unnamed protein product [Gongylonema pulchrum]|uniref:ABC transporter ATP-binding protein n=1 Tax=Gongylonema pulchrum TaxID=637853 RepID=A0A183DDQ7_9BILA|nr:unnamed protein product [Gongylonema pulchrum]
MLIRSDYQLVDYTVALLRKFGTQEMLVGLPWRVLAALLPPGAGWPRDSVLLMKKVARLTPQVVIFDETMFLISDKNHRRELGRKCAEWPYTTSVKLAALCEDGSEQ